MEKVNKQIDALIDKMDNWGMFKDLHSSDKEAIRTDLQILVANGIHATQSLVADVMNTSYNEVFHRKQPKVKDVVANTTPMPIANSPAVVKLKFQTHNDKDINSGGTSLIGEITADYADLKKVFGKPLDGDGYKVDAEWEIEFEDGTIATIYNWKNGKNYCGRDGIAKTKITDWHVSGFSRGNTAMVVKMVERALEEGTK